MTLYSMSRKVFALPICVAAAGAESQPVPKRGYPADPSGVTLDSILAIMFVLPNSLSQGAVLF